MELISNKADALKNRIRPGAVFVSKRTDNLKYVDQDGAECWVVPMSRYYAKETILRGQPVAICQLSDFPKNEKGEYTDKRAIDKYPYIKVFDPNIDEYCIGVATNYATEGAIVQVQNKGKFNYLTTESTKAKAEGDNPREVYIDASKEEWIYSSMRGQVVYVSTNKTNYHNDHDSKAEEVDNVEGMTYDFIDSVYSTKTTIQLGHLTDAPTLTEADEEGSDHTDQVITLELDVTGDTRGPLDNTQYILTLGEDIEFKYSEDIATNDGTKLLPPYYDNGIFDEVKVVALANHGPTKAAFGITQKTLQTSAIGTELSFIGVRKLNGDAIIIPINSELTLEKLTNELTDVNDRGYISLLKSYCNASQKITITKPIAEQNEETGDYEVTYKTLTDAIKNALNELDPVVFSKEGTTLTKANDTEADITENIIQAATDGGYFDIYESADLAKYFNIKSRCHGSTAPAGTAILADIRDAERTNVIGVVLSNRQGKHLKGETIKVMSMGRFVANGKFEVGKEYFLGLNGRITALNQYWYDTCVKIGTVETDHNLIVNVQEMQHDYSGSVEIGTMRPCGQGELVKDAEGNIVQKPERGFVLCDGETRWNVDSDKQYLWEYLLGQYSKEELQYDEATNTFIVPKVVMDDGKTVAQIKYTTSGIYHNLPRAPFLRTSGKFGKKRVFDKKTNTTTWEDADEEVQDFDITRLVHYGTLEQSRIAPTLENVEVRLFYRDDTTKLVKNKKDEDYADSYIWHELPSGFHVYNNDTLYGFEWVILQDDYSNLDGLYVLHMNTSNGLGVCKLGKHGQPIRLTGVEYKIQVTAKNLWTREYSLVDDAELAQDMDLNTDSLAPSVNAVRDYYKNRVGTKELEVFGEKENDPQLHSDKDGTQIKGPLSLGDFEDVEQDLKDKDDRFAKHIAETGTTTTEVDVFNEEGEKVGTKEKVVGVHGLINMGAEGEGGNLNAARLEGLKLGRGNESIDENLSAEDNYIPYVRQEQSGLYGKSTVETIGLVEEHVNNENEVVSVDIRKVSNEGSANKPRLTYKNTEDVKSDITDYEKHIKYGNVQFVVRLTSAIDNKVTVDVRTVAGNEVALTGLSSIQIGKAVLTESAVTKISEEGSSIAYKVVHAEKIDPKVKENLGTVTPNDKFDMDGNPVESDTMESYKTSIDELGSALQALYELPTATFNYKRGSEEYKEQLGILVERVNQVRDKLEFASSVDLKNGKKEDIEEANKILQAFGHKRNSLITSSNTKLSDHDEGAEVKGYEYVKEDGEVVYQPTANDALGSGSVFRKNNNDYIYSQTEAKSIANALNLVTNKKELAQEIRSTVGLLVQAAQETQKRLLDVETAVYGFDAETIPGDDKARTDFIQNCIDPDLQKVINNTPLLLGLNRLMRAICLELFDTTDLESIDKEVKSVLGDSDNLGEKVTVATRMDKIDELISDLIARYNGLVQFYQDALEHAELRRTYEHLSVDGKNVISKEFDPKAALTDYESEATDLLEGSGKTKHLREGTQVDDSGTWATLPSKEDLDRSNASNFPGYSKVNKPHLNKHRPKPAADATKPGNEDEVGIVRIPIFSEKKINITSKDGKSTTDVVLKQIEYDYDTGKPLFRSQGVAWLDSKVERINLKLSEVTKTIYGIDEVGQAMPNRTETMRRNITNLVDDLYPNRAFTVEKPADEASEPFLNPFNPSVDIDNGSRSAVDGKPTMLMEDESGSTDKHVSIIRHFIDDLYSFDIVQNYVPEKTEITLSDAEAGKEKLWNQTAKEHSDVPMGIRRSWYLNADALSTELDDKLLGDKLSFAGAYSQIDLLRDLIGEKDLYINKLHNGQLGIWSLWNDSDEFAPHIANRLYPDGIPKGEDTLNQLQKDWTDELMFDKANYTTSDENEPSIKAYSGDISEELKQAAYIDTILSRKKKTIANRLTTIEAALDSFAHFAKSVGTTASVGVQGNSSIDASNLLQFNDPKTKARFEETALEMQLRGLVHGVKSGDNYIFPDFDFDITTESFGNEGIFRHNLEVMTLLKNEYRVISKTNLKEDKDLGKHYKIFADRTYTTISANYNESAKDAFGNSVTPVKSSTETSADNNGRVTIIVKYVEKTPEVKLSKEYEKDNSISWLGNDGLDATTIYLKRMDVADDKKVVLNEVMGPAREVSGFENNTNQTTRNQFEMFGKMMVQMAQASFDMAHPLGSFIETDDVTTDENGHYYPNFHLDKNFEENVRNQIDTGFWERLQEGRVLRSISDNEAVEDKSKWYIGNDSITLREENIPVHQHIIKTPRYVLKLDDLISRLSVGNTGNTTSTTSSVSGGKVNIGTRTFFAGSGSAGSGNSSITAYVSQTATSGSVDVTDASVTMKVHSHTGGQLQVSSLNKLATSVQKELTYLNLTENDFVIKGIVGKDSLKNEELSEYFATVGSQDYSSDEELANAVESRLKGEAITNIPSARLTYIFKRVEEDPYKKDPTEEEENLDTPEPDDTEENPTPTTPPTVENKDEESSGTGETIQDLTER